jgi:nucleotide-binding universal stress UspA family protein
LTQLAAHPSHLDPHRDQRLQNEAREYLAAQCEQLRAEGLTATYKVLIGRGIADQVLEMALSMGADCIAVGTHRRKGAERVLLGSEADRIVRGAELPVLVGPLPMIQPKKIQLGADSHRKDDGVGSPRDKGVGSPVMR